MNTQWFHASETYLISLIQKSKNNTSKTTNEHYSLTIQNFLWKCICYSLFFDEINVIFLKVNPEVPNCHLIYMICTPKFSFKMLTSNDFITITGYVLGQWKKILVNLIALKQPVEKIFQYIVIGPNQSMIPNEFQSHLVSSSDKNSMRIPEGYYDSSYISSHQCVVQT